MKMVFVLYDGTFLYDVALLSEDGALLDEGPLNVMVVTRIFYF